MFKDFPTPITQHDRYYSCDPNNIKGLTYPGTQLTWFSGVMLAQEARDPRFKYQSRQKFLSSNINTITYIGTEYNYFSACKL